MPIKWRPFNLPMPKGNFPFGDSGPSSPSSPSGPNGGNGWIPFIPGSRSEEPAVDIYQDKNNLYVEVFLGGIKPENVKVSIEDNVLTIQGKTEEKKQAEGKDYIRKEIKTGSFRRVIKLPVQVKESQISAETTKGILKITVPKINKGTSKAKNVPIKIK